MPALRNLLLVRATSTRHNPLNAHKLLGDDDCSDEGSLGKEFTSSSTRRSTTDCTETSVGSLEETTPVECDRLDTFAKNQRKQPLAPASPAPEKQSLGLGSFLDRDRAMTSTSTTRSVADKRLRASKGRSRRVQGNSGVRSSNRSVQSCNRSVVSMPAAPSSPSKSLRESSGSNGSHRTHHRDHHHHRDHLHKLRSSDVLRHPASAPTGRKQKVAMRNIPRAPTLSNSADKVSRPPMAPTELYNRKAKSTRDLLKEYNNILDEFDDSTRGPRSKTVDLLEEYDEILTEYDDSARADRNTPYSTGWR